MQEIKEQISFLINIQKIDNNKQSSKKIIEKLPNELKSFEEHCNNIKALITKNTMDLDNLKKERKNKEIAVTKEKDKKVKIKNKLLEVKNNDEYRALNKEIDYINEKITKLEDSELEIMEQIEEKQALLYSEKKILEEENQKLKLKRFDVDEEINKVKKDIEIYDKDRNKVIELLKDSIYENYQKVSIMRNGLAVVPLVNNACQGCFIEIRPQMANEVKSEILIHQCPHCSRFLFWKDSTPEK